MHVAVATQINEYHSKEVLSWQNVQFVVLPKDAFEKGEAKAFRDYILERTGADFVWKPTGLVNICKNKWMQLQMKMASRREDEERK